MFTLSLLFALLTIGVGIIGFAGVAALPVVVSAAMFALFLSLFLVSLAAALTNAEFRGERSSSLPPAY